VALLAARCGGSSIPPRRQTHRLIILWLAAVNTAFAFTVWNHTLRTLFA